ncbi:MAG: hypothetical protein ABI837_05875 [Acidobacteriota bacterium]
MKKLTFLPAFFLTLSVAFAATVAYRISTYRSSSRPALVATTAGGRTAGESVADAHPTAKQGTPLEATTATIVEATGSVSSPEPSRARSAREQRFNELLRAEGSETQQLPASTATMLLAPPPSHPPAPTPPPQKPQSTMSRLLAPIVNALGGGRSAQASAPAPSRPAPSHPQQDPAKDPGPKDPTSDTTPPQLIALQFDPPAIHDGEATMLSVIAQDDLSGVRNISGSVTSPTGKALQGFALQPTGDPNHYSSRVLVPKDAEEGMWHINFLSLSDNASNTQNLNYSQGTLPATAQFRVTSDRPDSTPPTVKAVWLDKPSVSNGEKVTIFVKAEDDKSGVNLVSGVFQSPAKYARIGFGCRQGDAAWQCELTPPKCVDCGTWQLEQIQLQDKANNMGTVRMDNPIIAAVKLGVSGDSCDAQPPALQLFVLDQTSVSNAAAATITATASVSDDVCGVASVSGQAAGPARAGGQPPLIYFSFRQTSEGQWTGPIVVPPMASKGVWSVVWVQALDKANNLKTYSQSDPVLANAKFLVR